MTDENPYDVPAAPAAEVALLGAMLRLGEVPADVETLLEPDDFANPFRGVVFETMVRLVRAGHRCDHMAVISSLDPATLRGVNNGLDLVNWTDAAPVSAEIGFHAAVVARVAKQRRYLNAGLRIVQLAREAGEDSDLDDAVRQTVDAVPRAGRHTSRTAYEVLAEIIDPEAVKPGIRLGLADLDEHINPLLPGAITAIGARSGVGKTTFALDILRRAAYEQGKRALLVSIEMSDREVYTKALSAEARVDLHKIQFGHPLNPGEESRVARAVPKIGGGDLFVADVDQLTVSDYRALLREYKPDIAAIDFLGLCSFPKADRHELAVAEFLYAVKAVSAQETCHTLVLSQFNRAADHRNDKRPVMGDFRDSSGLEQVAHLALLLHRPDQFDPEERPGEIDVFVGKQRNGQAGFVVPLAAHLHYSQFASVSYQTPPSAGWSQDGFVDVTEPARAGSDPL
jgi:replicative DNA helicase